ncbi:Serine protease, subtilisin family [Nonomuraea solani]|uniref:Serine protease, subtilisin family n=1 Tax=Nonomuraea solani TaxID=1144553 RepID=A0A1H6EIJ6_9ACTN|nr:S8 family serine peptidase [Nonomuraea solani]SEG96776.1 Serine protease, subtilisin family [Nonomuraea solani]
MIRRSFAALGLLLSTAMAAPAAPPPAAPLPGVAEPPDARRITLITGDVVTYAAGPDGSPQAEVVPAPRPDGRQVFFMSVRERDAYYVYPTDALDRVSSGRLDRGLFDVAYLAANGYTDAESATLPLIVQRGQGIAGAKALPSIGGAAVKVNKKDAARFWSTTGTAKAAPGKIWLDRKIQVKLDRSVRQIGAPQAWAAGFKGQGVRVAVLDTGVDETHPDLAGRVAETANFTAETSARDGNGHGTHVASTIAGNGGKYTGVAPESSLLIGKVLNNAGGGNVSDAIAGMEWAVAQKARVVSMSFGVCCPGAGNPLDEAVDRLSAQSGALFVVAAGNDSDSRTIGSPGTAASALTVAAVDRSDQVASFSSKGPTAFDYTLKPDISAPGVDIVAARAQGTSMGVPVDATHTAASGTSMATPHVAGAAALLAGQHPDWTGPRLKAALTSAAHGDGGDAYEQGAGRVDVARAVAQRVTGSGAVDFGFLASPQNGPVSKTITYTNDGDQPVTFALKTGVTAHRGGAVPARTLTVDRDSVTVPARGTASVAVTFDPSGPDTWYEGFVRATAGDVQVTTAVGAFVEPRKVTVRTKMVLPDGATSPTAIPWMLMRTDDRDDLQYAYYPASGAESEAEVYPGTYSVLSALAWRDKNGDWVQSLPIEPQTEITGDTTITLDLRKAERVSVKTPRASEVYASQYAFRRAAANGVASVDVQSLFPQYGLHEYVMLPTERVTQGTFTLGGRYQLGAPAITMKVAGGPELTPRYLNLSKVTVMLDGKSELTLANGGKGTDFTGLDVRGKLVLLDLSDLCPALTCTGNALDRVKAAQAAGAAGVLGYGGQGRTFLNPAGSWPLYPIPTMSLTADQGKALAARTGGRPVTITAEGVKSTPYLYSLMFPESGRVPADLGYDVKTSDVQSIQDRFHADRPGTIKMDTAVTIVTRPGRFAGTASIEHDRRSQSIMDEYVGPVSPDLVWTRAVTTTYDGGTDFYSGRGGQATAVEVFDTAGSRTEAWGIQPRVPGNIMVSKAVYEIGAAMCFACRTDDTFLASVPIMGPVPTHQEAFTYNANFQSDKHGGKDELRLYRDGREIPLAEVKAIIGIFAVTMPTFPLEPARAEYRMTDRYHTLNPGQLYARDVESAWTFGSQRPTGGIGTTDEGICMYWFVTFTVRRCEPVRRLNVRYDVPLDLDNRIKAGMPHRISVTGYNGSLGQADAKVTDLKMWATFDDGAHWTPLDPSASGRASVSPPPLAMTKGAVGLKVQATDAEGNTVEQIVHRAYGLK